MAPETAKSSGSLRLQRLGETVQDLCKGCCAEQTSKVLRDRAGQGRAGQGRAGQGGAGQDREGQGMAGRGRAGHLMKSQESSCHLVWWQRHLPAPQLGHAAFGAAPLPFPVCLLLGCQPDLPCVYEGPGPLQCPAPTRQHCQLSIAGPGNGISAICLPSASAPSLYRVAFEHISPVAVRQLSAFMYPAAMLERLCI